MIFNNESSVNTNMNYDAIQESPYDGGLNGALMHIYETEMNYNEMMKSVGLSELKYYQETGGDLFAEAAGNPFKGFIDKAIALFKKIRDKVVAIFKKFVAKINQYTASDKDFVRKYKGSLSGKKLNGMEFEGYAKLYDLESVQIVSDYTKFNTVIKSAGLNWKDLSGDSVLNDEEIQDVVEKNRGVICGGSGSMTEAEMRDHMKERLYGDKDTIKNINIDQQLDYISNNNKTISAIQKDQESIAKSINAYIKILETDKKDVEKWSDAEVGNAEESQGKSTASKVLSNDINIMKSALNDVNECFGMKIDAATKRNRQAKAICVKALSYNGTKESANIEGAYSDIFADVRIL